MGRLGTPKISMSSSVTTGIYEEMYVTMNRQIDRQTDRQTDRWIDLIDFYFCERITKTSQYGFK